MQDGLATNSQMQRIGEIGAQAIPVQRLGYGFVVLDHGVSVFQQFQENRLICSRVLR